MALPKNRDMATKSQLLTPSLPILILTEGKGKQTPVKTYFSHTKYLIWGKFFNFVMVVIVTDRTILWVNPNFDKTFIQRWLFSN